ncbi:MAG: DUF2207 domain-containing protein [Erysipelotrichaceae bacterium]|nr:DUF2207 domain-containing protein [Erysipelotrichaceae bacterium]
MKKIVKLLLIAFIGLTMLAPVTAEAREAFDIIYHNVDVTVNEDGSFDIVEEMQVHFNANRHGIYVNIPSEYHMNWDVDGAEVCKYYKFPVTNVRVLSGHENDISHYDSFTRIKLGSASRYANTTETYKWSYTLNTRDLDLGGVEMVFLNIITSGWDTTTDATRFTLELPKSFDASKIYTSTPHGEMLQGAGELDGVRVSVNGNKITGECNTQIQANEAITIQVLLEKGYFSFPDINHYGIIGLIAGLVFTLIVSVIHAIYGRDREVIQTVEFHVPAGMTSAEVGTVIDEEVNDRDIISLLLDWGRRGIITIHETQKDLILEKKSELEDSARNYEHTMFNRLFNNRDKVAMSKLRYKFYNTMNLCKNQVNRYYADKTRQLSTNVSIALQLILAAFSFLPVVLLTALSHYFYYRGGMIVFIAIVQILLLDSLMYLLIYLHKIRFMVEAWKWWQKMLCQLGVFILFAIPVGIMFTVVLKTGVRVSQALVVTGVQIALMMFIMFMRRRTDYGNQELGRILGLREFIRTADEDRLKELVEENPYYFYDILPYAYALGLTEIWNEHFKDLTVSPCEWYDSYRPYNDHYALMHSLESQMHSAQRSMTSIPESSGGGGSGGGSSSGGGFSGGGGFGGSSGGSW